MKVFVPKQMNADWLPPGKELPARWKGGRWKLAGADPREMGAGQGQKCGCFIKYLNILET